MRRAVALVFTLAALAPGGAFATEEEAPVRVRDTGELDQATLDKAETLFFSALANYRGGRFEQAAVEFQKAYVLTRHRDLLFNVARSREKLGDQEGAVEWYRAYLSTGPADQTAVIHRIRQLGGDPTPARSAPDVAGIAPQERPVVRRGAGPWPWVSLGVGVAAAGVGVALGLSALDDASEARGSAVRSEVSTLKDSAESGALIADMAFGVSAVAIGTAVALWWLADEKAGAAGRVQVGLTEGGAQLGWGAHF